MGKRYGPSIKIPPASPAARAKRKAQLAAADLVLQSAPICPKCQGRRLVVSRERARGWCDPCDFDEWANGPKGNE